MAVTRGNSRWPCLLHGSTFSICMIVTIESVSILLHSHDGKEICGRGMIVEKLSPPVIFYSCTKQAKKVKFDINIFWQQYPIFHALLIGSGPRWWRRLYETGNICLSHHITHTSFMLYCLNKTTLLYMLST